MTTKRYQSHSALFLLTLIASVALIVAGFLVPPMGIIDGSVLTAVGELFAFGALAQLPHLVSMGKEVHIKHGETSVSVGDGEDLAKLTRRGRHRHDCAEPSGEEDGDAL